MLAGAQELLDRLEAAVADPMPDESRYYGWEPLPLIDFYRGMDVAGPGAGRRFLDAGSGIGSKLLLAQSLSWEAHGVEHNEAYIEISQQIAPNCSVIQADLLDFDGYGEFDLVYCYRPFVDPDEQTKLNHVISERLRPGVLFFSAGGPYPDWLEHVGDQVWRTRS